MTIAMKRLILMLPFITLLSCTERITEVGDSHGYHLECYNIKPSTRDSLTFLYDSLRSTLNDSNDFLNGVTLVMVDKFSHLQGDNSFEVYLKRKKRSGKEAGFSFYSDKLLPRMIVIQEKSHSVNDAIGYWLSAGRFSIIPVLRHSLMHEIGHQFDEYFGHDHQAKFARDYDSVQLIRETDPNRNPYSFSFKSKYESTVTKKYSANNGLSDKSEFKMAIQKDYVAMTNKMLADDLSLPPNMKYYSKGIDFSMDITTEMIDDADRARAEVYANLFSYAMGENDGDKHAFLDAFPNSFEVVKSDIKQYIQTE